MNFYNFTGHLEYPTSSLNRRKPGDVRQWCTVLIRGPDLNKLQNCTLDVFADYTSQAVTNPSLVVTMIEILRSVFVWHGSIRTGVFSSSVLADKTLYIITLRQMSNVGTFCHPRWLHAARMHKTWLLWPCRCNSITLSVLWEHTYSAQKKKVSTPDICTNIFGAIVANFVNSFFCIQSDLHYPPLLDTPKC